MILMIEPPLEGVTHRVTVERLATSPTVFCELRRTSTATPSAI